MNRDTKLWVRVAETEKAAWQASAEAAHTPLSEWVRQACEAKQARETRVKWARTMQARQA